MTKGSSVVAMVQITEQGYRGARNFTHAEPGDVGEVLEVVEDGRLMVRWSRRDSIAECFPSELAS